MSLEKLSDRKVQLIVKNVVRACAEPTKLNGTGYRYINLASGFIAHYNLGGFVSYYVNDADLRSDILANRSNNQYHNFRPGDENYEYYRQKGEIYNMICDQL